MKWLAAALAVAIVVLQYRVWLSEDGVRQLARLQHAVAAQRAENGQLEERNHQLAAEVRDLKTGLDALEERARSDLGMRRVTGRRHREEGRRNKSNKS